MDRFGSQFEDIVFLTNQQATRENIVTSLEELSIKARDGETLVIYFSGHGSAIPDQPDGDEVDGLDECLVPYDAPSHLSKGFPDSSIRDDYFKSLMVRLSQSVGSTGQVTLIFDCCHSGTMNRLAVSRFTPKASRKMLGSEDGSMDEDYPETVVVLSACQAREVALDEHDGGLFTKALVRALAEPRLTKRSDHGFLMSRIRANGLFLGQNPRFEGNWRLPVLGGSARAVPAEARLYSAEGWMNRGELSGFYPGTRVALGELVGEVVEALPDRSRVVFEEPLGAKLVGGSVKMVRQSSGPPGMKVYVAEGRLDIPKSVKTVEQSEEADFILRGLPDQRVEMWNWKGVRLTVERDDLADWLRRLSVRNYLMRLVHRPDNIELVLEPGRFERAGTVEGFSPVPARVDSTGLPLFRPGEHVRASITNRAARPLWIEFLNFPPDGHVVSLLSSVSPLEPGETLTLALSSERTDTFPEGLKVIGSLEPLDLSAATTRSQNNPLSCFLRGTLRGDAEQTDLDEPGSYVVGDTVFVHCEP